MAIRPTAGSDARKPILEAGSGDTVEHTHTNDTSTQRIWDADDWDLGLVENSDWRLDTENGKKLTLRGSSLAAYTSDPEADGIVQDQDSVWSYDSTADYEVSTSNSSWEAEQLRIVEFRGRERTPARIRVMGDKFGLFRFNDSSTGKGVLCLADPSNNEIRVHTNDGSSTGKWTKQAATAVTLSSTTWYWLELDDDGSSITCRIYSDSSGSLGSQKASAEWTGYGGSGYDNNADELAATAPTGSIQVSHHEVLDALDGDLVAHTKSFEQMRQPNLDPVDHALNDGAIDITVVGSPGTSREETHTVSLTSTSTSYSISWTNSHASFRVHPKLSKNSRGAIAPELTEADLTDTS